MQTIKLRLTSVSFVLAGLFLLVNTSASAADDDFASVAVMAAEELNEVRGRDRDTIVVLQNNQTQSANISETSFNADQINSGAVQLDSHALDNFNGVGLFNFVTGNGNAIDAAIGVNVYLQ